MDGKSFAIVQGDCLKIRWSNGQYCGFIINVCVQRWQCLDCQRHFKMFLVSQFSRLNIIVLILIKKEHNFLKKQLQQYFISLLMQLWCQATHFENLTFGENVIA